MISAAEKQERLEIVADVVGTHRAEGITFPPQLLALMDQYTEGDLTLEQMTAGMRAYGLSLDNQDAALVNAA